MITDFNCGHSSKCERFQKRSHFAVQGKNSCSSMNAHWIATNKTVGFCQCTSWQRANHTVPKERGGGLSHHGFKPGRVEWGLKEGGFWRLSGVELSAMGCFINTCQCQTILPFLLAEEQSRVSQSQCILVSSASFLVLACDAKWGHWASRLERGMPTEFKCEGINKHIVNVYSLWPIYISFLLFWLLEKKKRNLFQ